MNKLNINPIIKLQVTQTIPIEKDLVIDEVIVLGVVNTNPDIGVTMHSETTHRDAEDSHPIEAITGLRDELDGITNRVEDLEDNSALLEGRVEDLESSLGTLPDLEERLSDIEAGVVSTEDGIQSIIFDTTVSGSSQEGELSWNPVERCLEYKSGEATIQVGKDTVILVKNVFASMLDGDAFYIVGFDNTNKAYEIVPYNISIGLCDGILTQNLASGIVGWGSTKGILHNRDTSAFSVGEQLWIGSDAKPTNVEPVYPDHKTFYGVCGYSDSLVGEIFIDQSRAIQLSTQRLQDQIYLKATQNPGICQMHPIYADDITIDMVNRILQISTVNHGEAITLQNPITFFTDGDGVITKHEINSPINFPAWTDTSGYWFLYFDSTGTAITTQTSWSSQDFNTIATVYRIYWDATAVGDDKLSFECLETHMNDQSASDHAWKHAQGSIYERGLDLSSNAITSGAPNADGRNTVISLSSGTCSDDGLEWTITNDSTPTNYFEQDLGNTAAGSLDATNSGLFKVRTNNGSGITNFLAATRFPFAWNSGSNRPEYITVNGTRTLVSNNYYFVYYVYSLADRKVGSGVKIISAEQEFSTLSNARAHSWETLRGLYTTVKDNEKRPLYKLIFEYKSSYAAGCKYSALRYVYDIRKQVTAAVGASSGSTFSTSVQLTTPINGQTNQDSLNVDFDSRINNIGYNQLADDLTASIPMLNNTLDLSTGASFTKTLSAATEIQLAGYQISKACTAHFTGEYAITILPPLGYTLKPLADSKTYVSGKSIHVFICSPNSEIIWFIVNKE